MLASVMVTFMPKVFHVVDGAHLGGEAGDGVLGRGRVENIIDDHYYNREDTVPAEVHDQTQTHTNTRTKHNHVQEKKTHTNTLTSVHISTNTRRNTISSSRPNTDTITQIGHKNHDNH